MLNKVLLITLSSLLLSNWLAAQANTRGLPISIAYFSHAGYQPGAKISTRFHLKEWTSNQNDRNIQRHLYVSPQLGVYSWIGNHTSYLANVDIGIQRLNADHNRYNALSLGLGYLNQSQIVSRTINLSDGSKENVRENWAWLLPTINYEFGKAINDRLGWYTKLSYGLKLSPDRSTASVVFLELGATYNY